MTDLEAHMIETREVWWSALSEQDRQTMIYSAEADPQTLSEEAMRLIITAKSPAALATHTAWQGQTGAWSLTEAGRNFLLSQALDT